MEDFIRTVWSDIKQRKNLELYLALFAAIIILIADIVGVEGLQPGVENKELSIGGSALGGFDDDRRADIAKNKVGVAIAKIQVATADLGIHHQHASRAAGDDAVAGLLNAEGG